MTLRSASNGKFPTGLQIAALVWMLVWAPVYWFAWGPVNFLHLCDISMILTCIGLWTNSALLISSQAIGALLIGFAWALDAGWTACFGYHLIGGTEYLFNAAHPLWVRLLSLFHVGLVILLLWAVRRTGYRRAGWPLQSGIALAAVIASRFTNPALNLNYAFADPFYKRAWGPAPSQVAVTVLFLVLVAYYPAHVLFLRIFPAARQGASARRESAVADR